MNYKNFKIVIALSLFMPLCSFNSEEPQLPCDDALRSNSQQQMIAHFFNIVIQGLLLASAEKKEDQLQAAANAINSLSTITQLSVRSGLQHEALVTYVSEHQQEIMAAIASNLDLVCPAEIHSEHERID